MALEHEGGLVFAQHEPLPFESAEYDRRIANVRDGMRQRGVEALLVVDPRNIYYLTGASSQGLTHFQCLILLPTGDPTYITWDFEAGQAAVSSRYSNPDRISWNEQKAKLNKDSWNIKFETYAWNEDPFARFSALLSELGLSDAQLGFETRPFTMTAATFERVRQALPKASFVDPFGIIEKSRWCKSPAEIAYMREAARLTDRGVDAAFEMATVGMTDNVIAATLMDSMYRDGAGPVCWGPIVATGPNAGIGHSTFTGRKLEDGDTIFLEISASVHHYIAPVMRTAVLGKPTAEMAKIRDAGLASLEAVIATARPGLPANEVAREGMAQLAPIADKVHFHNLFGYPVGLGFPPGWFEQIGFEVSLQNEAPLEVGMCFHVPISLRKFAEYGVSQSQTVVITESGCEPLAPSSPALRVLG